MKRALYVAFGGIEDENLRYPGEEGSHLERRITAARAVGSLAGIVKTNPGDCGQYPEPVCRARIDKAAAPGPISLHKEYER
jgi:hypothetical protein